jgi:nucleotide-binding universal stress UspA family protein
LLTSEATLVRTPIASLGCYAVDADPLDPVLLLVIGLRRRTAVGKLLPGSAAQRILLTVEYPVLAVKGPPVIT